MNVTGNLIKFSVCLFLALIVVTLISRRTVPVPLPDGITVRTEQLCLAGEKVIVDLYLPSGITPAPVVVVAHGLSRNRKNMAGWGGLLAANGFIAAVPDLPGFIDYKLNSYVITELLAALQSGALGRQPAAADCAALLGFSMGGLSTLLAASVNANVHCWVGIDCVHLRSNGVNAARSLRIPSVVLRSDRALWNWQGRKVRSILDVIPGPLFVLRVRNSTHCDAEHPSNTFGEFFCGRTAPERRDVFEQYALAALRSVCFGDRKAFDSIQAATNDIRVIGLIKHKIEDFYPQLIKCSFNTR